MCFIQIQTSGIAYLETALLETYANCHTKIVFWLLAVFLSLQQIHQTKMPQKALLSNYPKKVAAKAFSGNIHQLHFGNVMKYFIELFMKLLYALIMLMK